MRDPLYTAAEMRAAEEAYPGTVDELMERAGRAVAQHALEDFGDARTFTVVCGGGSNGGDGRVAGRALLEAGRDVLVVDAKPEDEEKDLGDPDIVIDALFGTGFEGEPRPGAARLIEQINDLGAPVLSVDLPSGVDASTGEVAGAAVDADMTVTFHGEKVGHYVTPGAFLAGYLEVADIGLEPIETENGRVTREILERVPRRSPEGNKYTSGHVVVVGGSRGMTGAPCLSALAAFRSDSGYVTLAGPEHAVHVFETWVLEAVKRSLPSDDDGLVTEEAAGVVLELAEKAGALAIGPGLGRSGGTKALVRRVLAEARLPAVVDGDALWELEPGVWPAPRVLTPHSGELARLIGEEASWVDAHRIEAVCRAVERFDCVVLLKGAGTLIAATGTGVLVDGGHPSLATAGTGDVLTGVIAAFLAKGMDARLATAAGATAHHWAAIAASHDAGMIASDLLDALPRVLSGH
ncbi:MAG TPA: NAD(P)H-hydrate dehydratase [Gaiellaceae bacterium]|nr:NAD(P)H-hydrate dehydratase [Gaiellaceae bacterium]